MRNFVVALLIISSYAIQAQDILVRTPMYEVFSSSTCGPCKPANDHLGPIFKDRKHEVAVVKYQMSWPGSGDPYYSVEGQGRRGIYSISSIPYFVRNGQSESYSAFDDDSIDEDIEVAPKVAMELRYMIDADSQMVKIRAHVEVVDTLNAGAHRVLIAIIEHVNYNNVKTNGESEFHNVFKKMLPTSGGDFITGKLYPGDTFSYSIDYIFPGDYRLPNDANDPINYLIEHSVEDFDSLHVVMFMQSAAADREIYQADIGEQAKNTTDFNRPWFEWPLGVEDMSDVERISVYPNPANQGVAVVTSRGSSALNLVEVYSMTGELVSSEVPTSNSHELNLSGLPNGIYLLRSQAGDLVHTEKLIVAN